MGLSRVAASSCALTAGLFSGCLLDSERPDPCDDAKPGTACMWAGNGERGYNLDNPNIHRLDSILYMPEDVTFDPRDRGYIVDWNNHRIRRVEIDDRLVDVIGTDYEGDGPPEMEDRLPVCNPVGALATTVALNHMTDVEFGPDGLLYMAAWHNNKVRVFDPTTNMLTALAGDGYGYSGDGGPACRALFNQPKALAFAPDGSLFVIDQRNVRIRKIAMDADRTITTIAGTGVAGPLGDGGLAIDAQFGFETGTTPRPSGSLVYKDDILYVADSLNNRIRRIDLGTGIVDCIAGRLESGYSGDGGSALAAQLNFPMDIELGPDGRLYVADRENHAIRAIDLTTNTIETVAGGFKCNTLTSDCPVDGLDPRAIGLNEPYGVSFDHAGNMYISDTHNSRIVKVIR